MARLMTATLVAMLAWTIVMRGDDTAARWWAHVEALANDGMEGRNTGSPAHKRAAEYVAGAVKKAGSSRPALRRLHPAGRLQDAQDRRGEVEPGAGQARQDRAADARRGREHQRPRRSGAVGRRAARVRRLRPEHSRTQIDDLAGHGPQGRDRRLHLATPQIAAGPLQAHFGSAAERWNDVQAAGAIGTISIANPKSMDIPWARSTLARLQPAMSLADAALDDAPGSSWRSR